MDVLISALSSLVQGFANLTWQSVIMALLGCLLLYLGVARKFEPLLLIPIGFGVILGNLPPAGLSTHDEVGIINLHYASGILTEPFPCLLFPELGTMIDFGPTLANPRVSISGAAGTSAFPMSARVVQKEGQKANPRRFLLFHAAGANISGQIGSVMAAAVILATMSGMGIAPLT
jgi:Na+-transporting methylmalonyl-CoA/oxaloacetate decarboxylase beta subunit